MVFPKRKSLSSPVVALRKNSSSCSSICTGAVIPRKVANIKSNLKGKQFLSFSWRCILITFLPVFQLPVAISFPGELHIVHFNTKYPSFAEASKFVDGLAVLGVFIKVSRKSNGHDIFFSPAWPSTPSLEVVLAGRHQKSPPFPNKNKHELFFCEHYDEDWTK